MPYLVSTTEVDRTEAAKGAYFDLGVQYYVAARYSAAAGLNPVCANLFHHAIEMFLKGYLAHRGEAELRTMGHQLTALWRAFKGEAGDVTLDRFDPAVKELDRFDLIRYPDRMLTRGMQSAINFVPGPPITRDDVPLYKIVVSDIDQLVKVLFDHASVNPPFFTNSLNADAKAYLEKYVKALI